ncbi:MULTISPECIES: sodium-independent anion transporter [unclassified Pseudomonas]|uniref:sodium-independent anion transporter n=1 Tax=unclassified Pseudomonas TaxID=196821 RepID=UPI0021141821|nr:MULTISPECIES: sodium-independent anion transporter [unclassified Pseudomonas]
MSEDHPSDETFEGLLIVRPEGRLFFLNADYVKEQIITLERQYQPRVVVWDMSAVPDIEYSALQALIEGEKILAKLGTSLWLAGLNPGVLEMVRRAGFDERLGSERMLFNAHAAIERYQAQKSTLLGDAQ